MSQVTTEVLEEGELEALLAQINTKTPTGARNFALLQLMAQTGIRCGEALQVKSADVRQEEWGTNGDRVKVWVLRLQHTKGNQKRQGIPLAAATRQALAVWQEKRAARGIKGGPLFCTVSEGRRVHPAATAAGFGAGTEEATLRPGEALDSRYVRDLVKHLAANAGIERRVHPHMLRHTALTALYDKTRDLRMVQTVAGHTTSRMTERYTHVHPVAIAKAMGALEE
jgi:site-specific recombinase XerD